MKITKSTITYVRASKDSVKILDPNDKRALAMIFNDSAFPMYVSVGEPASMTEFSFKIASGGLWEFNSSSDVTVYACWVSPAGCARITDLSGE